MKTYKVLEAHIGDDPHNPYLPGDETYGTRTMAATEAKALIDMGLLAEIEEEAPAPEPEPAPVVDPAPTTAVEAVASPDPANASAAPLAPATSRKPASKSH